MDQYYSKIAIESHANRKLQGRDISGSTKWLQLLAKVDQQTGSTILYAYRSHLLCTFCMSVSSCHLKMNKLLDTSLRLLQYLPRTTEEAISAYDLQNSAS